jgi:hypothetical protein
VFERDVVSERFELSHERAEIVAARAPARDSRKAVRDSAKPISSPVGGEAAMTTDLRATSPLAHGEPALRERAGERPAAFPPRGWRTADDDDAQKGPNWGLHLAGVK